MEHCKSALVLLACVLTVVVAGSASAQNLLVNDGFEDPPPAGLTGWITFGNVFAESSNPPAVVPGGGTGVAKMFGTFPGVSGMFQEFPAGPGSMWGIESSARHWSGDALIGAGAPNDNFVVQKIVFKDAGDVEIGAVESVILDGTFSTDTWHNSGLIVGVAPAGTVQVEAFILFVQPNTDGGAALIDQTRFIDMTPVPTTEATWGKIKSLYR